MNRSLYNFNLSQAERTALMKRAAQLTAQTGRRVTMADLLREAISKVIDSPIETTPKAKSKTIEFTPVPGVEEALRRARLNSGRSMNEVVNELLTEAVQSQEISL